jgi:hypothetical protein
MIYTLKRGVNGVRVPVRYDTGQGLRRFLPALPAAVALPRPQKVKRYATYSVVPLLSLATILALILTNHPIPGIHFGGSRPHSGSAQAVSSSSSSNPSSDNGGSSPDLGGSGGVLQSAGGGLAGGSSSFAFNGGLPSPAPSPIPSPPPVGGRGGGGLPSGTVVCDNRGGVLPMTCTACAPSVVVPAGQKAVIATDPACALVN